MRFIRPILLVAAVTAIAAVGVLGFGALLDHYSSERAAARTERAAPPEKPVTVASARLSRFLETVEAVGSTRAKRSVEITSLAEGRVERVDIAAGQHVESGALLVALDDRAQRAAVAEAEASLTEAAAAYERTKSLSSRNITSAATLEQARANFLRAEASLDRARNALADREIRAPFAGTIGLSRTEVGARLETSTVIATLDDLSEIEIEFSVPEMYFPRVRIGGTVVARGDAYGDRQFEGKVSAIDSRISTAARAFKIRATIPNPDKALRTGMFMSLDLVLDERNSVAVPETAILTEGDVTFLYAVEDGRARRVEINIGLRDKGLVEVLSGLREDQTVITSGVQSLEDGAAVRPQEPDGVPVARGAVNS